MRTIRLHQTEGPALVTEGDQILTKDAHATGQIVQFAGKDDRLPEAPQVFAARRVRPDASQFLVVRRQPGMVIGTIKGIQKRCSFDHDKSPSGNVMCLRPMPLRSSNGSLSTPIV